MKFSFIFFLIITFIPCLNVESLLAKLNSDSLLTTDKDTIKTFNIGDIKIIDNKGGNIIPTLNYSKIQVNDKFKISSDLSRILEQQEGISMMSTGIGSTKPVIRGLFGNRTMVLLNGMKFDNQQWQNEHAMNLKSIGIEEVEIIKGPASFIYGSEALGGVINVKDIGTNQIFNSNQKLVLNYYTNTQGMEIEYGKSIAMENSWANLFVSGVSHSDYSDGSGKRVLNSRFSNVNLKANYGFINGNYKSVFSLNANYNLNGFIFNDYEQYTNVDSRWSKAMHGPHHITNVYNFSNLNTFTFKESELKINFSLKSNYRAEDEGGNEFSLKMLQPTSQLHIIFDSKINDLFSYSISSYNTFLYNRNYGKRRIIPDLVNFESNLSALLKFQIDSFKANLGLSQGYISINSLYTNGVNSEEKAKSPFFQQRNYNNFIFGVDYSVNEFNFKYNLSTGVRVPNLVELSSDGLHEGVFVYEIGNENLKNEISINNEIDLAYNSNNIDFGLSVYNNRINNYIYLMSLSTDWFGFPMQKFVQQGTTISGGEVYTQVNPFSDKLSFKLSYSHIYGVLDDKSFIPYIPANSIKFKLNYNFNLFSLENIETYVDYNYIFEQNHFSSIETKTPAYQIVDLGLSVNLSNKINLNVLARNIFDTYYFSHISRLKYFGYYNQGRDIIFKLIYNI